jgi:CRISPR-associated protein Csm3
MDDADSDKFVALLKSGIGYSKHDYLGGSGTRGYGQVKITLDEPICKTAEEYLNGVA